MPHHGDMVAVALFNVGVGLFQGHGYNFQH